MSNLSAVLRPTSEHLSSGRLHGVLSESIAFDGEIRRELRLSHLCNTDTIPLFTLSPDQAVSPRAAWHGAIGTVRADLEPGWQECQSLFARFAGRLISRLADYTQTQVPTLDFEQEISLAVDWRPYPLATQNFTLAILNVKANPNIHFAWDLVGLLLPTTESQNEPMRGIELMQRDGGQDLPIFAALAEGVIDDLISQLRLGLCGLAKSATP
jgi:hypothetical protein